MKTLIIDTSTQVLIVSFVEENKVLFLKMLEGKNNHSDNLLNTIKEGLILNNLEVKDFDKIICGIGPGAYTGLRVSLTVSKMFSWTLNIPLYTISSLDLLASGNLSKDGIYSVAMKAKKGFVYGKIIKVENNNITSIVDDKYFSIEEFTQLSNEFGVKHIVDENSINFDPLFVSTNLLTEVKDITFLEPNYLRGEM